MSALVPLKRHLPSGDFHFGRGDVRINTVLGTCVAIALWHPVRRIGGMCHFLLPARQGTAAVDPALPGLYAQDVIGLFARALQTSGTTPSDYVVKVAGGGNMFPDHLSPVGCRGSTCTEVRRAECPSIGCKNINAAHALLVGAGYVITSENVGGHGSRQVLFDLWSGDMWVKRGAAMAAGSRAAA